MIDKQDDTEIRIRRLAKRGSEYKRQHLFVLREASGEEHSDSNESRELCTEEQE